MKKFLTSGLILTGVLSLLVFPVIISAQITDPGGIAAGDESAVINTLTGITDWLFYLLIIGAIVVILIAAFTFLTAAGDAEKVKTARNYIVYALVAIVVAFLSNALVNWFVDKL